MEGVTGGAHGRPSFNKVLFHIQEVAKWQTRQATIWCNDEKLPAGSIPVLLTFKGTIISRPVSTGWHLLKLFAPTRSPVEVSEWGPRVRCSNAAKLQTDGKE
jgi:hypothetical protein